MADQLMDELNGLGKRVDALSHSVVACQASHGGDIQRLKDDSIEMNRNIGRIFAAQEKTNVTLAGVNGKLIGIGVLVPVVTALVVKLIG